MNNGSANRKSAFGSSQLTTARKFELDADTAAAANQIVEVVQEMCLVPRYHVGIFAVFDHDHQQPKRFFF